MWTVHLCLALGRVHTKDSWRTASAVLSAAAFHPDNSAAAWLFFITDHVHNEYMQERYRVCWAQHPNTGVPVLQLVMHDH